MHRVSLVLLSLGLLLLAGACQRPGSSGGDDESPIAGPTLEAPDPSDGFQFSVDFVAPAHSEIWKCQVYPLPTEGGANVNSVEYEQTAGMHHMTISTPAFTGVEFEPGTYDCEALYEEAMDSLTMMFGSQGNDHDLLSLPEGVAATLPADIAIVHEVHYVNVTDQPIDVFSRVNAYTINDNEVEDGIWGGQVRDENIVIPAGETATEWTKCVFNKDVDVHFLASHTHELGVEFTVALYDGETVEETFYTNTDLHYPQIVQYSPPLVVPAGTGFSYTCTWTNPYDHDVIYGLSYQDEMCNLAIVHTPMDLTALCEVVETSDGVLWEG